MKQEVKEYLEQIRAKPHNGLLGYDIPFNGKVAYVDSSILDGTPRHQYNEWDLGDEFPSKTEWVEATEPITVEKLKMFLEQIFN